MKENMSSLLKREEKLLKRLFSKRQQELLGYISHIEKRPKQDQQMSENAILLIEKHNREMIDLKKLEKKLLGHL
jgi:hypothetical protein